MQDVLQLSLASLLHPCPDVFWGQDYCCCAGRRDGCWWLCTDSLYHSGMMKLLLDIRYVLANTQEVLLV